MVDVPELDERKAEILRAIVEEYVETAQPVGSQTVARSRHLGVSSATVRNDMTVLEREGYIAQPHTSAGRIPTDRGYRYFVDHFTEQGALPPPQRRVVSDFFASTHRALEELLHETSQLLARVSRHAAMVVGPHADTAQVRTVQLVPLQPNLALVIAVLSNGAVEREAVDLDASDELRLAAAGAVLDGQLRGHPWGSLPELQPTNDPDVDRIASLAREALVQRRSPEHADPLYVGGVSRLAAEQEAFSTTESAARLLEMLEHQVVVVSLVRELLDQGLTVTIGAENRLAELRECAIVLAPYEVDGEPAGIVGVLGPTRMDYRHALAAVSAVSHQLGRHLS
ncbi:MAG TPA: heat-inducible transcriptional repressor HrcA [Acidimicrobiia bacterium]|nr:heat-inducible transcriptional repressor HrcA [Acidimicrobiia bacterium]